MATEEMVVDVSQDWVLACDVQQGFMQAPCASSDSLDYSGRCRQVRALGGDCFSFILLEDDCLGFTIGDASGKGLAAALMMASVQSSLRTAALFTGHDPEKLLGVVNQQAYASSSDDRYATLFYGVFEGASRILRYVNAGHNPPVVIRKDGSIQFLEMGGAPVGLFAGSKYRAGSLQLEPGDRVVAYTDGVIEAASLIGEEWGVEGLLRASRRARGAQACDLVQSIFGSMDEWSNERQTDDATVAVVQAI
jgi:sigma-B regulation protein RsbU (phosphoserine phosphatase)